MATQPLLLSAENAAVRRRMLPRTQTLPPVPHGGQFWQWCRVVGRSLTLVSRYPLASVVLSVLSYAFLGPIAALVLVATMLDHEFAHAYMMRRLGYLPGPVRLIPLVGAFVRAGRPMIRSADIALVYLAGPTAGILSAELATLLAAFALPDALSHQIYIGATVSVGLNLMNLLPFEPLDGGLVSRVLPYPALLLFPLMLEAWLMHVHQATSAVGMLVLYCAVWITFRKVQKWRLYVAVLRGRVSAGDTAAVRELQATFNVPPWERVFVVCGYLCIIAGGFALLEIQAHAIGWV